MGNKKVQVVLLDNVAGLGNKGTLVEVKAAYANNVLLRRGLAKIADKGAVNEVQRKEEQKEKMKEENIRNFNEVLKEQEEKGGLVIEKKGTDQGHLYSKIDRKELADTLKKEYGVEINEKDIKLEDKIEYKGEHNVPIKSQTVEGNLKVIVK